MSQQYAVSFLAVCFSFLNFLLEQTTHRRLGFFKNKCEVGLSSLLNISFPVLLLKLLQIPESIGLSILYGIILISDSFVFLLTEKDL